MVEEWRTNLPALQNEINYVFRQFDSSAETEPIQSSIEATFLTIVKGLESKDEIPAKIEELRTELANNNARVEGIKAATREDAQKVATLSQVQAPRAGRQELPRVQPICVFHVKFGHRSWNILAVKLKPQSKKRNG
eukprot:GHVU01012074.1.p2 GENE.GHVU01012074.1~~GHVU01012074.1.p2  ORF type:complete len:136 (+),score=19.02 GHVU01012074.1:132-539(+)